MFYDWLKVTQTYPFKLPMISDKQFITVDAQTGDVLSEKQSPLQYEGSYSTSIRISVRDCQLTIDGNPSKINRLDNLFGYTKIMDCIAVYNGILKRLGLPALTKPTTANATGKRKTRWITDGFKILNVHLTKNYSLGSSNPDDFLRYLSTVPYLNSVPMLHVDGNTVDWRTNGGKAHYHYSKVYNKSVELQKFGLAKHKRKFGKDDGYNYLEQLMLYCASHGVIRAEKELHSPYLRKHALQIYTNDIDDKFRLIFEKFEDILFNNKVVEMHPISIADQLIQHEICTNRNAANATAFYFVEWQHGKKFDFSKTQVRTHRARLRKLGIDIKLPYDSTKHAPVEVKRMTYFNVVDFHAPKFYKHPTLLEAV